MSWLKWQGGGVLSLLVVVVVGVSSIPQHHHHTSSLTRHRRQASGIDSITDDMLLCLFMASLQNQNTDSCGPTPLGPLTASLEPFPPDEPLPPINPEEPFPPEEPLPPIDPFPPEEPLPPVDPFPPEEPLPPISPGEPFPPEEPLPPIDPIPPVGPSPPVDPLPSVGPPFPVETIPPGPPSPLDPLPGAGIPPPLPPPSDISGTPPPPCVCVPHWECEDRTSKTEVKGDSITSVLIDLRSNLGCGVPEEVCCVNRNPHALPPKPPHVTTLACGQRNLLGVSNSFYGFKDQQTQFGEFPWTVALITTQTFGSRLKPLYIGGGSLIHPQLVMTVAHKLRNYTPGRINVRVGDWNLDGTSEAIDHQKIRVAEVLIHPGYSGDPYHYYDVALLVLDRPAVLGPTVNTICLPLSDRDYLPENCVISGWGKKNFRDTRFQKVMKSVTMPLVDHFTCQSALHTTRLGPRFLLHDSFLCAGGHKRGQDACTGDGGSPLVCPLARDPSRYVQVGVVAWGIECGLPGIPGVYADVLKAGSWIDKVLSDKFGSSLYQRGAQESLYDIRISPS